MKYLKFIVLSVFSCNFLLLASDLETSSDEKDEEFHWSKEKTEAANIEVEVAKCGIIQNFIEVPGRIVVHPDHIAYVIPKVNGSVRDIRKNIGDPVKKGEILAILESKEIAEAKSTYLADLKKFGLSQILLQREKELKGISCEQDYLNAELAAEKAQIHRDLSEQSLFAIGLTEDEVEKISHEKKTELCFYPICAPIEGKILQRNLTLGELISNTAKVFTIVDLKKVWVELNISQNNVKYLTTELPLEIISCSGNRETTKIAQFTPLINEESRTAVAIAVIENHSDKWTPGEFVTVKIETNKTNCSIVVPKTAIQTMKGETYIFVEKEESFFPSSVRIGRIDEKYVEILTGLEQGVKYAANNTFVLKAEYEKEEECSHHD